MRRDSKIILIVIIVGIALTGLIGVQIYWAYHAYHLTEKEFASDVKDAMKKSVDEYNKQLTCFETFSKMRINSHEGLYIMKQKWDNDKFLNGTNTADTIPMYFAGSPNNIPFKWTSIKFHWPVNVSMILQFQYILNDSSTLHPSGNMFEKITLQNYRDAFSEGKPIEERYNPHDIDSLLKKNLNASSIYEKYHFGFINNDEHKVAYTSSRKDTTALNRSQFRVLITPSQYFSRPFDVSLVFDNYSTLILSGIRKLLITSALIISILLVSFYLFVRMTLKQRRLSELKNDFINNMTHEFKTPLTNISLVIENMYEKPFACNEQHDKMIRIIAQESERLRENIERILQIARFEKEKLQLSIEQIDVHQLIKKAVEAFDSIPPENRICFHCHLSATQPIIFVDEMHLFNVIYNLIDNAIKYNPHKPEIEISTKDYMKGILITVKDNGMGISHLNQKKIFEKFYRVPSGNLHDVKGYGLGLSYAKLVVDAHHGDIDVKSQPGHGSEFEIYIPNQL